MLFFDKLCITTAVSTYYKNSNSFGTSQRNCYFCSLKIEALLVMKKFYSTLFLSLIGFISFAQVAVGIKINNPLFYGSSAGAFESNS